MAQNFIQKGHVITGVCDDPASPKSGDPVTIGKIPGVALNDEDADGKTTIATKGVFDLEVDGTSAIGLGDRLYYAAGVLSTLNTGVLFGKALEAVPTGTATIPVLLVQA